jgi:hypothetical protein
MSSTTSGMKIVALATMCGAVTPFTQPAAPEGEVFALKMNRRSLFTTGLLGLSKVSAPEKEQPNKRAPATPPLSESSSVSPPTSGDSHASVRGDAHMAAGHAASPRATGDTEKSVMSGRVTGYVPNRKALARQEASANAHAPKSDAAALANLLNEFVRETLSAARSSSTSRAGISKRSLEIALDSMKVELEADEELQLYIKFSNNGDEDRQNEINKKIAAMIVNEYPDFLEAFKELHSLDLGIDKEKLLNSFQEVKKTLLLAGFTDFQLKFLLKLKQETKTASTTFYSVEDVKKIFGDEEDKMRELNVIGEVLKVPKLYNALHASAKKAYSAENVEVLPKLEKLIKAISNSESKSDEELEEENKWETIKTLHIKEGAKQQVNVSDRLQKQLLEVEGLPTVKHLNEVVDELCKLMQKQGYYMDTFLKSDAVRENSIAFLKELKMYIDGFNEGLDSSDGGFDSMFDKYLIVKPKEEMSSQLVRLGEKKFEALTLFRYGNRKQYRNFMSGHIDILKAAYVEIYNSCREAAEGAELPKSV